MCGRIQDGLRCSGGIFSIMPITLDPANSFNLAQFRRESPDRLGELLVSVWLDGPMPDSSARRIRGEKVAASPVSPGSDGPRRETTATIRADVEQYGFNARATKCAFKGANHRFRRIRRKRFAAVFAGGS